MTERRYTLALTDEEAAAAVALITYGVEYGRRKIAVATPEGVESKVFLDQVADKLIGTLEGERQLPLSPLEQATIRLHQKAYRELPGVCDYCAVSWALPVEQHADDCPLRFAQLRRNA